MSYTIRDEEVERSITALAVARREPKIAVIRRMVRAEVEDLRAILARAAEADRPRRSAGSR
jgi:hypothetical protein